MRKKILLVVFTLFFSKNVFAQAREIIKEFTKNINAVQLERQSVYTLGNAPLSEDCTVFMQEDYFLGPLGQTVMSQMMSSPENYKYLLHGGSVNKYCPKYPNLKGREKVLVWVMIMTVMAQFESTCRKGASGSGPNGTAYGYFQLHVGKEQNYKGGSACPKNASLDPKSATKCALAMLENQMQRTGGDLFSEYSYWEVLMPSKKIGKAHQIANAIKRLSLCNPNMM
ncbi:MAG: hypothetical protein H7061_03365 [Bdellovibrionaceae bacterium]|nr:hypothetical protein [Bdellovibrio sp.]